jgi:hypothetical protein
MPRPAFAHHFHFTLDGLLDVLRIKVVTAHDQHVFQAPGDEQFAVADEAQIAGAQPGRPACWTKVLALASGLRQ